MRMFVASALVLFGLAAAGPAMAACTGHNMTVQAPTTTTTSQTAQIPVPVVPPVQGSGG